MSASKLLITIKNLFFVPACVGCGERLSPISEDSAIDHGRSFFCKKCMAKWQREREEMCDVCSNPASLCTCRPYPKIMDQPFLPIICYYDQDREKLRNRMILYMKSNMNAELFYYTAYELYSPLHRLLLTVEADINNCIFTWIPRTKRALRKNRFDQGEILCQRLAGLFGRKAVRLFDRAGGGYQKELDKKERRVNADSSIRLCSDSISPFKRQGLDELVQGKTVIIVDDVITTGATAGKGIELLKKAGAAQVLACALAQTKVPKEE